MTEQQGQQKGPRAPGVGKKEAKKEAPLPYFYRIRFREQGQESTAQAFLDDLRRDEVVMVRGEFGMEPAGIVGKAPACRDAEVPRKASCEITRRAVPDECKRYERLPLEESSAFTICKSLIVRNALKMHLVRVERFFNGSKMIFYFTADKRVDFRALVKDLVQEFHTRVEMRQVGVRHETKMIGGLGPCGRELCCSGYMKKFDSVSIKMAKEQDLPLNPAKISGVCNRLLCCLTYEFETYKRERKGMPRPGKKIMLDGHCYRVTRQNPLQGTIQVLDEQGESQVLEAEQWKRAEPLRPERKGPRVKKDRKNSRKE